MYCTNCRKIHFDSFQVAEKEVFSLTSFLSQTGGLLSIWIGLTMICIVEVMELFINCFNVFKANRGHSKPRTSHADNRSSTIKDSSNHDDNRLLAINTPIGDTHNEFVCAVVTFGDPIPDSVDWTTRETFWTKKTIWTINFLVNMMMLLSSRACIWDSNKFLISKATKNTGIINSVEFALIRRWTLFMGIK